ncbi:MAG TPA: hypothetical protein VE154_07760 [Chthoniobacterales bacterium]|nr:hypothetical protein [Chthoniobacterales bacterium]
MKTIILICAVALGLGALVQAKADDVQFVTLPQVVRTTVIRETNIPDYSRVTRTVRDENGIYEVTVRRDTDNEVLYVDPAGRLVREQAVTTVAPVQTAQPVVTQTVTETTAPTVDTFVRSLDNEKYQLIEKKGNKEVYRDRTTGEKWVVKVDREED